MLFNSFSYVLVFLPLAILLTAAAKRLWGWRAAQGCVLACSLFFYGFFKPTNLPWLLGSILVNWLLGRWLGATEGLTRKRVLQLGLFLDVAFLCLFKYVNLVTRSIPLFVRHGLILPDLEFPLGVSFFTITQIMYLVNCYEDAIQPSSLFDHATFVSFFPYVISGPISRAKRIIHQFPALGGHNPEPQDDARAYPDEIARGVYLFSMGLFKKVLFADAFAQAADFGFAPGTHLSLLEAWFFVSCYALQIYFDFSGYSDMAIGSALMLDIQLPPNFDAPLSSKSIIEFWQRWHISLTNFITNYLYTPMIRAFPKRTWVITSGATILAMAIAGLWHGPNWTFLVFGLIHGVALAINQNWRTFKMPKLPAFASWLITMFVVDLGFVFFRSPSLASAASFLLVMFDPRHLLGFSNILHMNGLGLRVPIFALTQVAGVIVAFYGKSSEARARDFVPAYGNFAMATALTACAWFFMNSNIAKPFVYFAF